MTIFLDLTYTTELLDQNRTTVTNTNIMTDKNEDLQLLREQQNIYDEDCEDEYLKHTNTTGDQYNVFYEFVSVIKFCYLFLTFKR